MPAFLERFSEAFGYRLQDPFDDICSCVADGRAFSFSRFGDGEFNAIFGVEGENCDGHRYFPDLGERLAAILASEPTYLTALQPLAAMVHGMERVLSCSGCIRWVLADCLQWALIEGRLVNLFDSLAQRDEVVLVAPDHLRRLSDARGWSHVSIPLENCWLEYPAIRSLLHGTLTPSNHVVLFCASMMSNVLIDDLHHWAPGNTYLDIGCAFDPCVGVNSRGYHTRLEPTAISGLRVP